MKPTRLKREAAPTGELTARQFVDEIARRLKTATKPLAVRSCEGLRPTSVAERTVLAAQLEACLGEAPSAVMKHRLSFPRRVGLYWEYAAPGEALLINGEISLNNLGITLLEKDFSYVDYGANPHLTYLDIYRILEDKPHAGDGNMAIVALNDAFTDVTLHYTRMFRPPHRILLSYEEYLRCELVTLGRYHWQLLFCDGLDPETHKYAHGPYKKQLVRELRMLWPDLDLDELLALADRTAPAPARKAVQKPVRKPARKPARRPVRKPVRKPARKPARRR